MNISHMVVKCKLMFVFVQLYFEMDGLLKKLNNDHDL